jgi:hypothetical protein
VLGEKRAYRLDLGRLDVDREVVGRIGGQARLPVGQARRHCFPCCHHYAPGKARLIGHAYYYRALEHAVRLFGPVRTRTIAITGLEAPAETIRGAAFVASLGVMSILSPFRPLDGSDLTGRARLSAAEHLALHDSVATACAPLGIVPGPTCIACQNNTLAFPSGDPYQFY